MRSSTDRSTFLRTGAPTPGIQVFAGRTPAHTSSGTPQDYTRVIFRNQALAEGVETEAEVQAARALGCTMAQGFLYDRALPPDGIDERIRRQPA